MSRIRVFTGHFGSGKTEIAINYALKLNEEGKKVAIADLDIVNPYFCTRDQTDYLEEKGIKVIATPKEFSNAELGTVPLNTLTVFNDKTYEVVLDVGGDDQGAVALGQYNKYFREEDYDMYFVINTIRPLTNDVDSIIQYIDEIQRASRLKVKYLINNTNLSYETTVDMIKEGLEIVKEVSEKINIPIAFTAVREDLVSQVKEEIGGNIFPIKIFMLPPWRRDLE
jgi:tRNA uridine 5-carbamoylmethylation protein Kti12